MLDSAAAAHILTTTVWILAAVILVAVIYTMQRRHTLRELEGRARQMRHLYRARQTELQDIEALRLAQHDAQNELVVLQGFLERDRPAEAAAYLDELLRREQQRPRDF